MTAFLANIRCISQAPTGVDALLIVELAVAVQLSTTNQDDLDPDQLGDVEGQGQAGPGGAVQLNLAGVNPGCNTGEEESEHEHQTRQCGAHMHAPHTQYLPSCTAAGAFRHAQANTHCALALALSIHPIIAPSADTAWLTSSRQWWPRRSQRPGQPA